MTREQLEANLNELSKERLIELLLQQYDGLAVLRGTLDSKLMLQ